MKVTPKSPAQLADAYGALMAEKAAIAAREKALKEAMQNTGLTRLRGNLFDVTISYGGDRKVFDRATAEKLLTPGLFAAIFKQAKGSTRFAAKARVAEAV